MAHHYHELFDLDNTIDCDACRGQLDELSEAIKEEFGQGIRGKEGITQFSVALCAGSWIIGNNHGGRPRR